VRIIAATNKQLDEEIEQGKFRADLFYRLNVIPFEVPPLRERIEDLPLLVDYFNQKYSLSYNRAPKVFSDEALVTLKAHPWLGNVRELRNIVERVVIMTSKTHIEANDLPPLVYEEADVTVFNFASFREGRDAFERNYILRKLAEFDGNVTRTAEAMGYDRSYLYRRMKTLGINGKQNNQ